MRNVKLIMGLAAAVVLAVFVVPSAQAQPRHPRYLHARSDLRAAQHLLRVHDEENVMRHIRHVDWEIDQAIGAIDRAAVIDHRDIDEHMRPDREIERGRGRLRQAMELLRAAREDLGREEDNRHASGWRDDAYRHIDGAIDQLRTAIRDLHWDREGEGRHY
jgi:hypothetical protein